MNPFSDILRTLLIDRGQGSEDGEWPIFIGLMQDAPDDALCIYDTAGKVDGRCLRTGEVFIHPGIQIVVRGRSYPDVFEKVSSLSAFLDGVSNFSVAMDSDAAYTVHNVSRAGAPINLGVEDMGERRRHSFAVNATLTVTTDT